jgi:hypothetical protein
MDKCTDENMGTKRVAAGNRLVAGFAGFVVVGNRVREFAGFVAFAGFVIEENRIREFAGFVAFAGFAAVAGFPVQTLCADDIGAPSKNILCTPLR